MTPNRREFIHRSRAGDYPAAMSVLAEAAEFLARKGESATLSSAIAAADGHIPPGRARVDLERCRSLVEYFTGTFERAEVALRTALAAAEAAGLKELIPSSLDLASVQRRAGRLRRRYANT